MACENPGQEAGGRVSENPGQEVVGVACENPGQEAGGKVSENPSQYAGGTAHPLDIWQKRIGLRTMTVNTDPLPEETWDAHLTDQAQDRELFALPVHHEELPVSTAHDYVSSVVQVLGLVGQVGIPGASGAEAISRTTSSTMCATRGAW